MNSQLKTKGGDLQTTPHEDRTQLTVAAAGSGVPQRSERPLSVALIGAGYIAEAHASILSGLKGIKLTAVLDIDNRRAAEFAERWKIPMVVGDLEALSKSSEKIDVAHVLVPPQLHMSVAAPLLSAGIHTFIEKPLAQSPEECEAIAASARAGHSRFGVNHNFKYHPAHQRAATSIRANKLGQLRHVSMVFNMPLHQLNARQFGHWMFDCPRNLLLEQAVHPLSQIDDFIGPAIAHHCFPLPSNNMGGWELVRTFLIDLHSDRATAQLQVSVGQTYSVWRALLICDDGAVTVDYINNRVIIEESKRWLPPFERFHNGISQSLFTLGQESKNIINYLLSTAKLQPRTDDFYLSMKASIQAFYESVKQGGPESDQGPRLVALCSALAPDSADTGTSKCASTDLAPNYRRTKVDAAIIGGTGFIGQHLVAALLQRGKSVIVFARNLRRLPSVYNDPKVLLVRGNAINYEDVRAAIADADAVVHLAHGGGSGATETYRNLIASARAVAQACTDTGTRRLVFVSSIAALYVGDPGVTITDSTGVDPYAKDRAAYSAAKAEAERLVLAMHREHSVPVCIVRPGVVIGEGGLPFHSGVGFFNSDRHCLGWNKGDNPLPFVLASDVADAIVAALYAAGIEGRSYNLVGDVRLTAQEYIEELGRALGRPLRFHPQSIYKLLAIDFTKYLIKRAIGRRDPPPSLRDLRSRGLVSQFDCRIAARDLGWSPVADRTEFVRLGIQVYGRAS